VSPFTATPGRFLVLLAGILLAGCSALSKKEPGPACPTASVLEDANRITVYRPGPGRDIADIVYEARLISVEGDCSYQIDENAKSDAGPVYKSVSVNLRPRFIVTPGPAMSGYTATVNYFVAIPEFYPHPEGRSEFTAEVETSAARTQVDVTDSNIEISIPLNEKRRGDSVGIFVGFVLTDEQLRENRTRTSNRLFR